MDCSLTLQPYDKSYAGQDICHSGPRILSSHRVSLLDSSFLRPPRWLHPRKKKASVVNLSLPRVLRCASSAFGAGRRSVAAPTRMLSSMEERGRPVSKSPHPQCRCVISQCDQFIRHCTEPLASATQRNQPR